MTIADLIAAGMAVLDQRAPGWLDRIDLERLDMAYGVHEPSPGSCGCVLAQVDAQTRQGGVGHYADARMRLIGDDDVTTEFDWAIDHGFTSDGDVDFEELTEAWRRAILARRAAVTS
jgi:hypothetical protein